LPALWDDETGSGSRFAGAGEPARFVPRRGQQWRQPENAEQCHVSTQFHVSERNDRLSSGFCEAFEDACPYCRLLAFSRFLYPYLCEKKLGFDRFVLLCRNCALNYGTSIRKWEGGAVTNHEPFQRPLIWDRVNVATLIASLVVGTLLASMVVTKDHVSCTFVLGAALS
jgi:hypothetical protein